MRHVLDVVALNARPFIEFVERTAREYGIRFDEPEITKGKGYGTARANVGRGQYGLQWTYDAKCGPPRGQLTSASASFHLETIRTGCLAIVLRVEQNILNGRWYVSKNERLDVPGNLNPVLVRAFETLRECPTGNVVDTVARERIGMMIRFFVRLPEHTTSAMTRI